MDLKNIKLRLEAVRSHVRRLFLIEGALRVFATLAVGLICLFLMDYFLRLPLAVRGLLEIGFAVYMVKTLYLHLYYPLTREITEDDIAIVVERRFPDLKERLISTLQLNRALERDSAEGVKPNQAMVAALSEETLSVARDINFMEAIFPENLKKVIGLAAAFFVAMSLYTAVYPANTGIFVERLLGSNKMYPPKTFVTLLTPADLATAEAPSESVVGYGTEVNISVRVTGKPRKRIMLFRRQDTRSEAEAIWEPSPMEQDANDPEIYRMVNPKAILSFDFRVVAGDGYLPGLGPNDYHRIVVDYPPRIVNNSIEVGYDYPAYTRLESRTDRNRMIKAPVGTTVTYRAQSDIPVTNAYIKLYSTQDDEKEVATVPMTVTNGNELSGIFTVTQTLKYALFLEKVVGDSTLSNAHDPIRGGIDAIIDEAPVVSLRRPKSNGSVTAAGYVPFELLAKDDYGVSAILVQCSVKPNGSIEKIAREPYRLQFTLPNVDDPANPLPGELDVDYGADRIEGAAKYRLKDLDLKEGDFITLQIEARDNRDGEPNVGRSREFNFAIVDEEVIREEIAKRLADLIRRLDAARTQQIDLRKGTFAIYDKLKSAERVVSAQEKIDITHNRGKQQRLTTDFAEAKAGFDAIIDLYYMNNIVDPEQVKIEGFARELDALASTVSPAARDQIIAANTLLTSGEQVGTLAAAVNSQDDIIARLDRILADLNKYADYNHIIRYTRQLLKFQQKILEDTQKAAQEKEQPK